MDILEARRLLSNPVTELLVFEYTQLLEDIHLSKDQESKIYEQLEAVGTRVGRRLAEVLSTRRDPNASAITHQLDVFKFVCRDVWMAVFGKQISNLRTDYKGIWLLRDDQFLVGNGASAPAGSSTRRWCLKYMFYYSGILLGALSAFGLKATATPSLEYFPACMFHLVCTPESGEKESTAKKENATE